jgi:hypothetical protein
MSLSLNLEINRRFRVSAIEIAYDLQICARAEMYLSYADLDSGSSRNGSSHNARVLQYKSAPFLPLGPDRVVALKLALH